MDNSKVVFISHSSADNNISEQIYNALESRGVGCWMDKFDIVPGIPYARAIMNGIEKCNAFVVLLSPNSVKSDDVLNEIDSAHNLKKQLIPVFLEGVELPKDFSYYLKRRQWIVFDKSVDTVVDSICEALSKLLGISFDSSKLDNQVQPIAPYNLKIKPNLDCNVFIDEDDRGIAKADTITRFALSPGEYTLSCVSTIQKIRLDMDDVVITNGDVLRKPEFDISQKSKRQDDKPDRPVLNTKKNSYSEEPDVDFQPVIVGKEHFNIGVLGHANHGKTTLSAAISSTLAESGYSEYVDYDELEQSPIRNGEFVSFKASSFNFQTEIRRYTLTDFPSHQNMVKGAVAGGLGMDGAIMIVAATDGSMPETRNQLLLAKELGVSSIVVFLNKCDLLDDDDLIDLVEAEIRELLSVTGYDGDNTPIIRGSALAALNGVPEGEESIMELLDATDNWIPVSSRIVDKTFVMPIDDVYFIEGRGTVATGRIQAGVIHTGDPVDIVGRGGKKLMSNIAGVEMFRKILDQGEAGDNVGLLLKNINHHKIRNGMIICEPRTIKHTSTFEAVTCSDSSSKIDDNSIRTCAFFDNESVKATFFDDDFGFPYQFDPGFQKVRVSLSVEMPVFVGQYFTISAKGSKIVGCVTKVGD